MVRGIVERQRAVYHGVEHHAYGPDVGHVGLVRYALQDLRGRVRVTAAEGVAGLYLAVLFDHVVSGKTKVRQLDVVIFVHQ